MLKPYPKYGDWYIPGYNIRFPTETEAWEYIRSLWYIKDRLCLVYDYIIKPIINSSLLAQGRLFLMEEDKNEKGFTCCSNYYGFSFATY